MKAATASPPPTMNPLGGRTACCRGQRPRMQSNSTFSSALLLSCNTLLAEVHGNVVVALALAAGSRGRSR